MEKKIIVRTAAGLGNQMFMYAHAYALAKKINYKLLIDNTSAYFQKKNRSHNRSFKLDYFNISSPIADQKYKYDNYLRHILRKLLILIDRFKKEKSFKIEHKNKNKITYYKKDNFHYSDKIYVEGYYESEKYFVQFKDILSKQFTIKNNLIESSNKYIDMLKSSNSVSIHVRRNRFIEPDHFAFRGIQTTKRINLNDVFSYIKNAILFFEKRIKNPQFFIWSNNFSDLDKIFDRKKFIFVENNSTVNDFYLFNFAKHFIVGPSSFHWWGAWLNTNKEKICVRPPDTLNPSTNLNFWPDNWKKIS